MGESPTELSRLIACRDIAGQRPWTRRDAVDVWGRVGSRAYWILRENRMAIAHELDTLLRRDR
jgi:hypothetical protein